VLIKDFHTNSFYFLLFLIFIYHFLNFLLNFLFLFQNIIFDSIFLFHIIIFNQLFNILIYFFILIFVNQIIFFNLIIKFSIFNFYTRTIFLTENFKIWRIFYEFDGQFQNLADNSFFFYFLADNFGFWADNCPPISQDPDFLYLHK
jgi:hypothetical protein